MAYGPIGEQFTATFWSRPLALGDLVSLGTEDKAMKCIGIEGKTASGKGQWYRFEIVAEPA